MGGTVMSPCQAPQNSTRFRGAAPPAGRCPCRDAGSRPIEIRAGGVGLEGALAWPCHPSGFVLLVRARGGEQARLTDQHLAARLRAEGLGTVWLDRPIGRRAHALEVQAERLAAATAWLAEQPEAAGLPLGLLGSGGSAATALITASSTARIGAVVVVLSGGRPDRLSERLSMVRTPTLLIVGERDDECLRLCHPAMPQPGGQKCLTTIPDAGARLEEAGALEEAGRRAALWFVRHLVMAPAWRAAHPAAGGEPPHDRGPQGRAFLRSANSLM